MFCLLIACIGFVSCKKDQAPKEAETEKKLAEKPISVECYKALYEQDTIDLKINNLKNGNVSGNMVMKFFGHPAKVGEISGKYHGDTLFVDYTFSMVTNKATTFKNPMAMLKKGEELILGSGKIETYLGRSFFSKDTPIDFEKVKFKFSKVKCEEK
ncbi:hypothetical protein FEM08_35680 [Flavobacterium gilvum]|nr:hypothetical protein FEM08_35680 [Flavobacterium gilvum]